jgi:hypothetical protein
VAVAYQARAEGKAMTDIFDEINQLAKDLDEEEHEAMTGSPASTFPEIRRAFDAIDADSGGYLIGTAYPGELDPKRFMVPAAWSHLCAPAEAALKRLREISEEDWRNFVIGEYPIRKLSASARATWRSRTS